MGYENEKKRAQAFHSVLSFSTTAVGVICFFI